jgi:hypothetical protein
MKGLLLGRRLCAVIGRRFHDSLHFALLEVTLVNPSLGSAGDPVSNAQLQQQKCEAACTHVFKCKYHDFRAKRSALTNDARYSLERKAIFQPFPQSWSGG